MACGPAGVWVAAVLALVSVGCTGDTSPATPVVQARDAGSRSAFDDAARPAATSDVDASDGTALRLTFSPEAITPEAEAGLDGRGFLRVRVFGVALPAGSTSGSAEPLHEETVPRDPRAGAEIAVTELPAITIPLLGEQRSVFVEAVFFDQPPLALGPEPLFGWGWWVGGMDLSRGLSQRVSLEEIALTRGQVTPHDVPLVAYRRVHVTATVSATPPGDGQGSLSVAASRAPVLPPRAPTFGYGIEPCVDLHSGTQHVDIGVVGSGDFYVAGFFDDLGIKTPGAMPPGTMISVRDVDLATYSGTFDRLTLAPRQYSGAVAMDLGYLVPLPPGVGPFGPNSCRDLGYLVDAGP